ncbi:MAG: hypothetical protein AVDCRST_MAG89-2978 [uncultured Gemmatimonadetes bacterium]|uniref:DUF1579 domain-containing protein n=1 Tax=uncultured Gemmatimonadota bacterium TaxID=203437 RepID=A0A6J4M2E5_9BACT|nr:MAG: hypothetical protein AVDCRST_MAG89-2978 [uncultured Gemmatimonadota bacterium]
MNPIETLAACAGTWSGPSTLQDPINNVAEESASTLVVTPVLGGRFVRMDYTWAYQGKPQEGSLLVGFDPKANTLSAQLIDTWHVGYGVMAFTGSPGADRTLTVRGSYAAPPGPDWGWRIDVAPGDGTLRITHYNVWPEGKEDLAVDSLYTRA